MKKGLGDEAVAVAEKIAALDPKNIEIRKRLAQWQLERGKPASAIAYMADLLRAQPDDPEILTALGNYSLSVGDEAKFNAIVAKLGSLGVKDSSLHSADVLVASGKIDAAVKKYYEIETADPQNARLALKIGRLAVIRRSESVIAFELDKLQKLGDPYALAMLEAYIAAGNGKAAEADAKFAAAVAVAKKSDAINTASAEINVLLNRQKKVNEALDKAVSQSEPTLNYIVTNPLFRYLENETAFVKLRARINQQKTEIAAALQNVQI
jgi:predicted Zn-dependent protease